MNWKHGYHAEGGYTFGYFSETMPVWLQHASLLQDHLAPKTNFRYLDAGCGQGLNLILAAINHPDSEFIGVDFMPEHIAHAKELTRQCGITNVSFHEADFRELADAPFKFGTFDYAVCHGITTWIDPEIRTHLFNWIGKALLPSGLFYNSYNTFPGWLATSPFQHLVLLEQRTKSGLEALLSAQDLMEKLSDLGSTMFDCLPELKRQLMSIKNKDPNYLVQEYNNLYWQPVYVAEMIEELSKVKLEYLGTATLAEAALAGINTKSRAFLSSQNNQTIREQLKDYVIQQSFRRDLYVKGKRRPWRAEKEKLIREIRLIKNPVAEMPEEGKPFITKVGRLDVNGDHKFYSEILNQISSDQSGKSIEQLMQVQPTDKRGLIVQACAMLLQGQWVLPISEETDTTSAQRCNKVFCELAIQGAPYKYLALPKSRLAAVMSPPEWVMLDHAQKTQYDQNWPKFLKGYLRETQQSLEKDGQKIIDPNLHDQHLEDVCTKFKVKINFLKYQKAI